MAKFAATWPVLVRAGLATLNEPALHIDALRAQPRSLLHC
jgi:hypothetical protein